MADWYRLGSHAARYPSETETTAEKALEAATITNGKPTPIQAKRFRMGYRRGRINRATEELDWIIRAGLSAADMEQLGDEVHALVKRWLPKNWLE